MNDSNAGTMLPLDVRRIFDLLPHRYPFLLVDRVTAFEPGKRLTAIKNVTINEPFFQGHFPGNPVMPGVLIIEALAQASGVLVQLSAQADPNAQPLFYLVKVDKARFSRIVAPGDQLVLQVEQKRMIRKMGQFWCQALVDGEVVAEAEILCAERND
ncbi:3-hydroxyacyl-ACP dehydratase FabZ [Tahibacter amnicola]|uniref:3-hydroxyacyl-[acyl-carrier-protein] dehydratase FabZ n=1 Tax=Tahibacter amnicola TaxID=2976241 RepID=A0ABY6BAU0_9GAMM|nr:3-hydroxyacyl-ACP dehydratase FabZ [Tahibacter amnicola]UXI66804.1 3-hydroxyacyl-ACP dehydratase FabZ [Tahibacter amnicola]